MDNRYILGKIFQHIGEALCDPESKLCKSFVLSNEQLGACLKLLKIASAPQTHRLSVHDLAFRYNVCERTIRNWHRDGAIPKAREDFDGKPFWMSHEMFEVDRYLIKKKYVSEDDIRNVDFRLRDLLEKYTW